VFEKRMLRRVFEPTRESDRRIKKTIIVPSANNVSEIALRRLVWQGMYLEQKQRNMQKIGRKTRMTRIVWGMGG
jgi:hypothetical protein